MLKYIGITLAAAGIALLLYTIIRGRQKGIDSDKKELAMITSSGYVSERTPDEKKGSPFEGQIPVKTAPKKKRVLSKEARSMLEQVENDRAKQAEKDTLASAGGRKGTAVLDKKEAKGTDILPGSMNAKGTDVLPDQKKKGGTAVLPEKGEKKGTAVLDPAGSRKKGTDILPDERKKKGTEVLTGEGKGTAVLAASDSRSKGTDILNEQEV